MPDFSLEQKFQNNQNCIIGIDEVGRGPWAGPVVASAVCIPKEIQALDFVNDINDSKKLSFKKRETLFDLINEHCFVGIGIIAPKVIDSVNILQASFLAMDDALNNLVKTNLAISNKEIVSLIDGNKKPNLKLCTPQNSHAVIKGDSISTSIAAASIIAKVTRDRIMADLHETYPHYGWNTNSGYGTKVHIEGLDNHGVTEHHRKSFKPIKLRIHEK